MLKPRSPDTALSRGIHVGCRATTKMRERASQAAETGVRMLSVMEFRRRVLSRARCAFAKAFRWALQTSGGNSANVPARAPAISPIETGSHVTSQPTNVIAEAPARRAKVAFKKTDSGEAPVGTAAAAKTGRRREGNQSPVLRRTSTSWKATLSRAPAIHPGRAASLMCRIAASTSSVSGMMNRLRKAVPGVRGSAPPCRLQ